MFFSLARFYILDLILTVLVCHKITSMHQTQSADAAQPNHPARAHSEQAAVQPRKPLERLFERTISLNKPHLATPSRDTYVSDIINVQSLLNIRTAASGRDRRLDSKSFEDRIIINVCGDRYETHRSTLELYPNTLLGSRKRRRYFYDKTRNEYFFDRNRACFEAILYYYQSHGRLRRPNYVSIDIFLEEVTFFQLGEAALEQLRKDENIEEVKKLRLPKNRIRKYIWATMEYPNYSLTAKLVNVLSLLMILASTVSLAVETLPEYGNTDSFVCHNVKSASNDTENGTSSEQHCETFFTNPFFIVQTVCMAFFTVELLLRLVSTPSFLAYLKNIMNWIDVFAVVPYYLVLTVHIIGQQENAYATTYVILRSIRIIRFVRIFKFYRVFRNIKSLRVLTATLKQSIPDFVIMIVILTLTSFLFGAAVYFAEHDSNGQAFDSIPKATYWGVMTITSVGYGDIYPITAIGRVLACLCGLLGAATIGMLVSVLVDRYQRVYARKLYINDDTVDFYDGSDDENNECESRKNSGMISRRNQPKPVEELPVKAIENAAFDAEEIRADDDEQPKPVRHNDSRTHFIIGYIDDANNEASLNLLDTISSVVSQKQNMGENVRLNIVADSAARSRRLSPYDVKFRLSVSSNESDEDEELTEIVTGCENRGNVLRRFQAPPSPEPVRQATPGDERATNIL